MSDQDFDDTEFADDGVVDGDFEQFDADDAEAAEAQEAAEAAAAQEAAAVQASAPQDSFAAAPAAPAPDAFAPAGDVVESKGDVEVDRRAEWRLEYNNRLDAKRAANREAIQARKEAAAKAIAEYYERKEATREAKLSAGRTSEQTVFARLDEVAAGNTWDRVLSLVDVKQEDLETHLQPITRFKNVLLRLKNEPVAADA